jgi:hypothetical protein
MQVIHLPRSFTYPGPSLTPVLVAPCHFHIALEIEVCGSCISAMGLISVELVTAVAELRLLKQAKPWATAVGTDIPASQDFHSNADRG